MWEDEHCSLGLNECSSNSEEPGAFKFIIWSNQDVIVHVESDRTRSILETIENQYKQDTSIKKLTKKDVEGHRFVILRAILSSLEVAQQLESHCDDNI